MALSIKKELAARLIALGHTQAYTYRDSRINVTKQTMSNWNQEEEFIKRVKALQTDTVAQVQETLIKSAPDAADALVDVISGNRNGDDIDVKMIALRLKGSLWILDRVLGKSEKIKNKPVLEEEEEDENFAPDEDEIDNVLKAINE